MKLPKTRRIILIFILAGLIYYDWPILMSMLGSDTKRSIEVFETTDQIVYTDSCRDEKFTLGWINDLNIENLARVSLMNPKVRFSLDLNDVGSLTFRKGGIISVGTDCARDSGGNCSNSSPYSIHVGQCAVKKPVVAMAWDWSGAFDKIIVTENFAGGLRVDVMKDNKKVSSLELGVDSPKDRLTISELKLKSEISSKNFFRADKPYNVYVNGVEMTILSLNLS